MWHAILLLFRESEKLAWYSRDAPLPSTSPLFATLTHPLALLRLLLSHLLSPFSFVARRRNDNDRRGFKAFP